MTKKANPKAAPQVPQSNMVYLPTGHILEFSIRQIVYLKTDPEQRQRIISKIMLNDNAQVQYVLMSEVYESVHYGFELETEKNIMLATSN